MANVATTMPAFQVCSNPACDTEFKFRKNKTYCSPKCRLICHREEVEQVSEELGYKVTDRDCADAFYTAMQLARQYYNTRPQEREDFVRSLIMIAYTNSRYRRALTCPKLVKPKNKEENTHLFLYGLPQNYYTIAEIVNSYCVDVFRMKLTFVITKGIRFNLERLPYRSMDKFDTPFAYVESKQEILSAESIEQKMVDRPLWIKNMMLNLHADQTMPVMEIAA